MAWILCIETATESCSVCLSKGGEVMAWKETLSGYNHASMLTVMIEEILHEVGIGYTDLNAVAVSKGPGSYTGLRVGVSSAKGLCYALGIPLLGIPTLQSLAYMLLQQKQIPDNAYIVPMIDARRMEIFTATFDAKLRYVKHEYAHIVTENSFAEWENRPLFLIGNGAKKCETVLQRNGLHFMHDLNCSARGLAALAQKVFLDNQFEDTAYFEPFYLKEFAGITS